MKHLRLRRAALPVLFVAALVAPPGLGPATAVPDAAHAASARATTGPVGVVLYRFEAFARNGGVTDQHGGDDNAGVHPTAGGTVRPSQHGTGYAATFPAPCRPTAQICPRAILEAPHRAQLNPGTRPIRYGAAVRLPASHTSAGENIMQKGSYAAGNQWKLQVDGAAGAPSCVLVGNGRAYRARSSVGLADGRWHRVECRRTAGTLTILLDAVATGRVAVPGDLSLANPAPLRIGGNSLSQHNDQFFGALDDVFVLVG